MHQHQHRGFDVTDGIHGPGTCGNEPHHIQQQQQQQQQQAADLLFGQVALADLTQLFSQPQTQATYTTPALPTLATTASAASHSGIYSHQHPSLHYYPLSGDGSLSLGQPGPLYSSQTAALAPMTHAHSSLGNASGADHCSSALAPPSRQPLLSTHTSVVPPVLPPTTAAVLSSSAALPLLPLGAALSSSGHHQHSHHFAGGTGSWHAQCGEAAGRSSLMPSSSNPLPAHLKVAPRRITLNAQQQLVTLQYFYDMYPEEAYPDEDLFRLSQACGLEFEFTKRRLANLNGKQRDLRNALFTTDLGLDQDMLIQILTQAQQQQQREGAEEEGEEEGEAGSRTRASGRKKGRPALSLEASLCTAGDRARVLADLSSRKRAGKDERILVELHHREVLGAGYIAHHCHVLGQGKPVKDWLASKRAEVQAWLERRLGNAPLLFVPVLADPQRLYYVPTTPAELLESEIGPLYLQYTASLRPKRGSSSVAMALAASGQGGSDRDGGGWLSRPQKASSASRCRGAGGDPAAPAEGPAVAAPLSARAQPVPAAQLAVHADQASESVASSIAAAAAFMGQYVSTLRMHAGAGVLVSPNEPVAEELAAAMHDLGTTLRHCTDPVIMRAVEAAGPDSGDAADLLDRMFGALYLWLHPRVIDQRSVRSELTLAAPIARDACVPLAEQVAHILAELRNFKRLPSAMVLTLGAIGLDNGNCALVLMVNKTMHHPLYMLPGVSAKSVASQYAHGAKRKRADASSSSSSSNGGGGGSGAAAAAGDLDEWLDEWLLVQDRAQHRLRSDLVFIRRGSFEAATVRRAGGSGECTIQPTPDEAARLSAMGLDIVGRPWKGLGSSQSRPTSGVDDDDNNDNAAAKTADLTTADIISSMSPSIVYHFSRTVLLDDLDPSAAAAADKGREPGQDTTPTSATVVAVDTADTAATAADHGLAACNALSMLQAWFGNPASDTQCDTSASAAADMGATRAMSHSLSAPAVSVTSPTVPDLTMLDTELFGAGLADQAANPESAATATDFTMDFPSDGMLFVPHMTKGLSSTEDMSFAIGDDSDLFSFPLNESW